MEINLKDIEVNLPNGRSLYRIPHMQIKPGSHILIKGQSGCGKTTFLHMLAGLFRPTNGMVSVGNKQYHELSDSELCTLRRSSIGVIFQKLNILDHLTVEENIQLVGNKAGVLSLVGLNGREQERCAHLSLGEQQRVAVARVLAQAPKMILADEPTSSLDQVNSDFVMQSLQQASEGKTLIVVSHDERIEKYFDRIIDFKEFTI